MKNKIYGAIMGAIVGDAIGLPFEFKDRNEIKKKDIKKLNTKGYHNLPIGTWSDDSSMILCTTESMLSGYNYKNIGDKFCEWKYDGHWTPYGVLFDIGGTTSKAITNIRSKKDYSGVNDINSCGNGSLMRIIPLLFYIKDNRKERFDIVKEVSSLTHSNIKCIIACSIYIEVCLNILDRCDKVTAYEKMKPAIINYYKEYNKELNAFHNILYQNILNIDKNELSGSGYVIHTLESTLYSFLSTKNFKRAIYTAILLGDDTDTVASITGGLAGLYYGYTKIPQKWNKLIVKKEEILDLLEDFYHKYNQASLL